MAAPHRIQRLRRRAQHLEEEGLGRLGERPDPQAVIAAALRPVWIASLPISLVLAGLSVAAPALTGDGRAALLTGPPAAIIGLCWYLGRRAARRRVTMILATAAAGFLALATCSVLKALENPSGGALFQFAAWLVSMTLLVISWPAWKRVEREGNRAQAQLALYEEL